MGEREEGNDENDGASANDRNEGRGEVPGSYSTGELADIVPTVLPADSTPGFYAVSGSHLYGWADAGSDVDVRGFHIVDGRRYAFLDPPDEQLAVERSGNSEPAGRTVDLVSYELRKFGVLVANRNFNALEVLFDGDIVLAADSATLDDLRGHVEDWLPMDVPARYAGMARSNRDAAVAGGDVKRCLYAVRGLLAAHHVADGGAIEANVQALSESVLGGTVLVDALVEAKRAGAAARLDDDLAARASRVLDGLEKDEWVDSVETAGYRAGVDEWMRDVRGWQSRR